MKPTDYAYYRVLPQLSYDQAVEKVTETLKTEGFGVLTTIDVKDAFKRKIDRDFKRYVILGACNPHLAHQALSADDTIGLLLPCNVVVAENGDGSEIGVLRPSALFSLVDNDAARPLAEEADQRLQRALEEV